MDRVPAYAEQVPYALDFLNGQRGVYEGVGLLMRDILGTATLAAGLACVPTTPASLAVNVAPGRVYSLQHLEPTAWAQLAGSGGLAADTNADHDLVKQGVVRDTQALAITAPSNPGQSINYLIQVGFSEADAATEARSFYNPAAPDSPTTNNVSMKREDRAVVQAKAGVAAATGSQVTPAPDAGFVGVWVVTVAYGAADVQAGNITAYANAPLVLSQTQILALINACFSTAHPPAIADVTGLAAALAAITPGLAQGQIIGLGLSNTIANPNTQITVAVGTARDNQNTTDLVLAAAMTKSLTGVWAAGNNNGGRDSAVAIPVNSYYHAHLIWNPTGPTVDVLFSQSATAPTLPTGYTKFRRIGSFLTDAAGNIRQFVQIGRRFELVTRTVDFPSATANAGGPFLRQLIGVPRGVKVRPILLLQSNGTVDGNPYFSGCYDPDKGIPPAFGVSTQWAQIRRLSQYFYPGTWGNYGYEIFESEACSPSGQIYTYSNDGLDSISLGCLGWVDDLSGFN